LKATGRAPTRRTRAPRGPATKPHYIPENHELSGVSTLTGPEGEQRGQWSKTRVAGADEAPHDPTPPGHLITKTSTFLRGDGTTIAQWIAAEPEKVRQWEAAREAVIEHVREYVRPAEPLAAP